MRQLRGWVVLLAAVAVVALLVAGCGKKAQPEAQAPVASTTPAPGATTEAPAASAPGSATAEAPAEASAEASDADSAVARLVKNRQGLRSYEMVTEFQGETQRMFVKFDKGNVTHTKIETPEQVMYFDMTTKEHYMYDPKTKTAVKLPVTQDDTDIADMSKLPPADEIKKMAAEWDSTTLNGVDCWTFTTQEGTEKAQVWVDKEYGLPRQMKMGEHTVAFTYKNMNKVPDSEFELPPGTKIQDMGDLMKNMPQPPGE
ncbi:MAG: hypothetical protein J7M26_07690 [Armatimonadetes bacterium]|nr:hypothetical protein [Armatimonadota bacterium]